MEANFDGDGVAGYENLAALTGNANVESVPSGEYFQQNPVNPVNGATLDTDTTLPAHCGLTRMEAADWVTRME